MRPDMFKVIVERPRIGGCGRHSKGRRKESNNRALRDGIDNHAVTTETEPSGRFEQEPSSNIESIKPKGRGADRKAFNENLSPLWRYLQTQIGRCWDDVYSDIRTNLSPKNTVQMHVVQHLKQKVTESTYLGKDGRVYETPKYYRGNEPNRCLEESVDYGFQFYVHPVTREFCVSPQKSRKTQKPEPSRLQVAHLTQYRLINGQWMVVEFEKIPKALGIKAGFPSMGITYMGGVPERLDYTNVGDVLNPGGLPNHKRLEEYGFINVRVLFIRPLGKRETKKLNELLKDQYGSVG